MPNDLLTFSLRAGAYLSSTRTAAYLWIKENPEKAEVLLADELYRSKFLALTQRQGPATPDAVKALLSNDIASAYRSGLLSHQLLFEAEPTSCQHQMQNLTSRLSESINSIITNLSAAGDQ